MLAIPTEPIGTIPRPLTLIEAMARKDSEDPSLEPLRTILRYRKPHQRIFVGVVAPIDPQIETPEEVRDRVLEAAEYTPLENLGTTDDCGFAPFSDGTSTSPDTAFTKIRARVVGTALAAEVLGAR